jgi:hypothetical protein
MTKTTAWFLSRIFEFWSFDIVSDLEFGFRICQICLGQEAASFVAPWQR